MRAERRGTLAIERRLPAAEAAAAGFWRCRERGGGAPVTRTTPPSVHSTNDVWNAKARAGGSHCSGGHAAGDTYIN